jgi:membrane protein implicated in regulation of membrane protease activity
MFRLIAFVKTLLGAEEPINHHPQAIGDSTYDATPAIEAIVTQTIGPGKRGQVKCQGSWWTAKSVQGLTLLPGKVVYVISRQNITLYVEPAFIDSIQGH